MTPGDALPLYVAYAGEEPSAGPDDVSV